MLLYSHVNDICMDLVIVSICIIANRAIAIHIIGETWKITISVTQLKSA